MIKFATRPNLIYPLQLLIFDTLRDVEVILIKHFFGYKNSTLLSFLMFIGEFIVGLIFYLYYKKYLTKHKEGNFSFLLNLGAIRKKKQKEDSKLKIAYFLVHTTLLKFFHYTLIFQNDKFLTLSRSVQQIFIEIFLIYLAIFYSYLLRLPLFKHQIFSLIVFGICALLAIITELIFQQFNTFLSYGQFIGILIALFFITLILSFGETIEKYLMEYDQLSPLHVMIFEGIIGLVISSIYNIYDKSFSDFTQVKKNLSNFEFVLFIFSLILYTVFIGGKNIYRLVTIKIFSPMTSTFVDYIFNPFYFIYYFLIEDDFLYHAKTNYAYFIINLILSFITSLFGCVYNEFLILFCCGLERDTHNQVLQRAFLESDIDNFPDDNEDNKEDGQLFELINMNSINK